MTSLTASEPLPDAVGLPVIPRGEKIHPLTTLRALTGGNVPMSGEPSDVTREERGILWKSVLQDMWTSEIRDYVGDLPLGLLTLAAHMSSAVFGVVMVFQGFWQQDLTVGFMGVVGAVVATLSVFILTDMKNDKVVFASTGPKVTVMTALQEHVREMSRTGCEMPAILHEVMALCAEMSAGKVLRRLGAADMVAMMRLDARLAEIRRERPSKLVLEGETTEMLARAFEELGGVRGDGESRA